MDSYKLQWKQSAVKELRKLPPKIIPKVVELAESLCQEPYPSGVKKLAGTERTYRVRTGQYRVIYTVFNQELVIEVIRVGHRKEVYRKGI